MIKRLETHAVPTHTLVENFTLLRSILIPLEGSESTTSAISLAMSVAKRHATASNPLRLTGISILDRPTIEKPQAVPPGAVAFKRERDERLLDEADQKTRSFLDDFKQRCSEAGFECDAIRAEGRPFEQIAEASRRHDAIVIGRNSNFHFTTSDQPCETFRQLLNEPIRPVVVTPEQETSGKSILIAYDGSSSSARTLHMFALQHINFGDLDVHVVTIDSETGAAERKCDEAIDLLARHQIPASPQVHVSRLSTSEVLMTEVDRLNAGLIVMGTAGHKGWQNLLFGSTTQRLIDNCPLPMFLYR